MKIILALTLLLLSFLDLSAQEYWIKQSSPTSLNLKKVFFINNTTGWIAGDSGFIARTTNAGQNWSIQDSHIKNDIQGIFFINERLGWGIAWEIAPDSTTYYGTKMLKTTDGGDSWIWYMYPTHDIFMKTIFFVDSAKGFLGGAPLNIVYTTDAGQRWTNAETDTSLVLGFPVEQIKFFDPLYGYACGGFRDLAGCMWRTSDGGHNWNATIVGPEPLNDLYIFNKFKVIAAGGDFEYGSSTVKTSDQGLNWNYDTIGTFGVANSLDFRKPNEGWISLGIAQKFSFTTDTGKSWQNIFTPDSIPMFDIDFTDSLNGWAVGYSGYILKYNANISSINIGSQPANPETFVLYQNFPNPFNPVTTIDYKLITSGLVSLKVYDTNGKELLTLINQNQPPGNYSIQFDGSNFSSGIYFYKLESGNISETRRMVLLK